LAGVAPSGTSWAVSSRGSALSVASTDAGKLYKCYGDFDIDFAAAATLGGNFGAAFANVGSGRVALKAAAGQWIGDNSLYSLTPGEAVVVNSDATELLVIGGRDHCKLAQIRFQGTSLSQIDIKHMYPGEFAIYELALSELLVSSTTAILARVSQDSGSSYISAGYGTTAGDTIWFRLFATAVGSQTNRWSKSTFNNGLTYNNGTSFLHESMYYSAGSTLYSEQITFAPNTSPVNALRVLCNSYNFIDANLQLFGRGRIRR
jgi:hypothetical protein